MTHQGADGTRHSGPGGIFHCSLCAAYDDAYEPGPELGEVWEHDGIYYHIVAADDGTPVAQGYNDEGKECRIHDLSFLEREGRLTT